MGWGRRRSFFNCWHNHCIYAVRPLTTLRSAARRGSTQDILMLGAQQKREGKSNHALKLAWILCFNNSNPRHTVNDTVKNFSLGDIVFVGKGKRKRQRSAKVYIFLLVTHNSPPSRASMARWRQLGINLGAGSKLDSDRFGSNRTQAAWC
jgi:hypothetical protein